MQYLAVLLLLILLTLANDSPVVAKTIFGNGTTSAFPFTDKRLLGPNTDPGSATNVKTFGAVGDGVTDDTAAITAAIAAIASANGGLLYFPPGIYLISSQISGISNLEIACNNATITTNVVVTRALFYFTKTTNTYVHGCKFDQAQPRLPVYSDRTQAVVGVAILFDPGSSNIRIIGNAFTNLYTNALFFYHAETYVEVASNTFTSPQANQNIELEHMHTVTFGGRFDVHDNTFVNAPPLAQNINAGCIFFGNTVGSVNVSNNSFDYCGRSYFPSGSHPVATVDFYTSHENVTLNDNIATNNMWQFARVGSAWPAEIGGNTISRGPNASSSQLISIEGTAINFGLARSGSENIDVHDNTLMEDYPSGASTGIGAASYDYATPIKNLRIHNNSLVGFGFAALVSGVMEGVSIDHNQLTGASGNIISVSFNNHCCALTADHGVTEAQSRITGISITDNYLSSTGNSNSIQVNLEFDPAYIGTVGDITIERNVIKVDSPSVAAGIFARGPLPGAPAGQIFIRSNKVTNFSNSFYLQNWDRATIIGNDTWNISGADLYQERINTPIVGTTETKTVRPSGR